MDSWTNEDFFEDEYDDPARISSIADPLYYFNYSMYTFNDKLYYAFLKPVATGYKYVVPQPARKGISHFFHNLVFPIRFVNNLLQGRLKDAGTEIQIFIINSTIGCLGFVQVAQDYYGLTTSDEDLGQTLGSYHVGNGFYLVLPVFGPSTLRDTLGRVGDLFLNPLSYVDPWEVATGARVCDTINETSFRLGEYEAMKAAALDPYVAVRNAYIQHRGQKIKE